MTDSSDLTVRNGDISLVCRTAGDPALPLLLFLHGFPEFSGAWEEMFDRLSDRFYCVAPDQRGYGRSSAPHEIEAYALGKLVSDALAVLDAVCPGGQAAAVVGHDWGASVAYGLAMRAPDRMVRLIIANGVHPIPFQRELARGGAQTEASQYITWLRNPAADDVLAADDYARLMAAFSADMDMSWLSGDRLAAYKDAWSGPGTLRGMINWYRASPLVVPKPGETARDLPDFPVEAMRIRPPHLLIWGERDTALLPASRDGLGDYCNDLTVKTFTDADHWIIHQKPDEVAALIADFAGV